MEEEIRDEGLKKQMDENVRNQGSPGGQSFTSREPT